VDESNAPEIESPTDILLWQDGFWCFRAEFAPHIKPDFNYEVITAYSPRWLKLIEKRALPPHLGG